MPHIINMKLVGSSSIDTSPTIVSLFIIIIIIIMLNNQSPILSQVASSMPQSHRHNIQESLSTTTKVRFEMSHEHGRFNTPKLKV